MAIDLGNDTAICAGNSLILNGTSAGASSYLWNTNASTPSITVNTAGTYWLRTSNASGCFTTDTINVRINALPNVHLGSDTSVCANTIYTLNATSPNITNYLWNTNATTPSINLNTPGNYHVTVTDNNGCKQSDSVVVSHLAIPTVQLGADITDCIDSGWNLTLNAGNLGAQYLWDNNTIAPTRTVQ